MEMTLDYLKDTATEGNAKLSDIGSIIALAILEAGPDRDMAIEALEGAIQVLKKTAISEQAQEVINGAIFHLQQWDEEQA